MVQMAQISADHSGKPGFRYESDAAASFLVMECDAKVLEYQALMLEHNHIRHVLPVDVIIKEGLNCYYYNITSKISLSFFVGRRKLSREEFLKLLLDIASVVNDSAGYLLTVSNYVFDPEYIYISPETLEPMLVYVPAMLEGGSGTSLQTFISDLLMQHINAEGFGGGNLVQRILSEVKSELFNMKSLISVINDLLYANLPDESRLNAEKEFFDESKPSREKKQPQERKLPQERKPLQLKGEMASRAASIKVPGLTALAILAQIAMGTVIYAGHNFLNHISDNPTATYAAVMMIVLAVDALIFKRLNAARLIHVEALQEGHDNSEQSARTVANRARDMVRGENCDIIHDAARETIREAACELVYDAGTEAAAASKITPIKAAAVLGPAVSTSGKTELLAGHSKGARMLKSIRRQSGDEDIFINKDDFIIGRLAEHVDHVINNNAVGKLHAQLLNRNGTCYIKDLNSVNGTFVNSKRIESNKEYELKENDRVLLANSEFVYIKC